MMTAISLRLSDSLHKIARELAHDEGISMNQLITLALAEKVSALATESYLEQRAARGDRAKFEAALAKVADVEPPDERDRLE
ncbi:CopG domain protein DNA-binding domain protein [Candidatus Promineifilum breve]|uniref:CopG domain protein DNA-binding domain protein n=1 Tax=Candidatus Promineifilum breve TaxID=1806508 RepID=A0A170PGS0_9CHLR|nr:toxin-antitoxin system HicB family antitoxin [Candidatus Promineifilum breve]CUS03907.2 CopG domain protein DNA-binding domain protein [Candidatus Promineifilum breve]